jgi:CRP/FNR family transcriptional regulator, cyclic AMP receptor protein
MVAITEPMDSRAGFLARIPLLAGLAEAECQALAGRCRVRSFKPGEILFHEEDAGQSLYLLQSGRVKIVRVTTEGEETLLHVYGAGECFGELSLVDAGPRSATAVVLEPATALILHRDDFWALVERHPAVAVAVMQRMSAMVRRLNQELQDALSLDLTARLSKRLLELAATYGDVTPEGMRIGLRLTQHELAQMVGATRTRVTLCLGMLKKRGILTADRNGIVLHKPEELRKRIY